MNLLSQGRGRSDMELTYLLAVVVQGEASGGRAVISYLPHLVLLL